MNSGRTEPFRRCTQTVLPCRRSIPFNSITIAVGLLALLISGGCVGSANEIANRPTAIEKYAIGVHEYKLGDRDGAIRDLNDAIHQNPNLRMARVILGDVYRTNGQYAQAAEQYEAAARLDPYSSTNRYNLGVCYQFLHRLEDAAAAYLQALNLEPKDVGSSMNLGLVYLALGRNNQAQKYLQRATVLDPRSSQAWANYGVSLDAAGMYPDAAIAYRKAIELDSGSIPGLQNLASNLISQKQGGEAVAVCQQLLLRLDSPSSRTRYGDALALTHQVDAAKSQYDLALKRDRQYYPALSAKGFLLIQQYQAGSELDETVRMAAIDTWNQSLKLYRDQPKVLAAMQQWEK